MIEGPESSESREKELPRSIENIYQVVFDYHWRKVAEHAGDLEHFDDAQIKEIMTKATLKSLDEDPDTWEQYSVWADDLA